MIPLLLAWVPTESFEFHLFPSLGELGFQPPAWASDEVREQQSRWEERFATVCMSSNHERLLHDIMLVEAFSFNRYGIDGYFSLLPFGEENFRQTGRLPD